MSTPVNHSSSSNDDDDDEDEETGRMSLYQPQRCGISSEPLSQTDCVDNDDLSHVTTAHATSSSSSSSSSLPAAADAVATHRMPATLPLTTGKQHPQHHTQRQLSAENLTAAAAAPVVLRCQSINNNDTSY